MHPGLIHRRFLQDLSSSLFSFVLPLLPTSEERAVKEEVRTLIEKLIKTIEPSARLLAFGSSQNSFGLKNSDMDLVVLIDDPTANLEASHLVQMIGDLLQRNPLLRAKLKSQETNFDVKPLPKARIPILKLTLSPSPALPFGIACDIGIENRLAIENTRLLLTYATIDPARVRTLVLFSADVMPSGQYAAYGSSVDPSVKVWSKRRRINSPYRGTLSSYGFTLMVLYFLTHVKQPPVLPNLQRIAPIRQLTEDEVMIQGRNVYFFDDTETLRQEWSSINFDTIGELLIDFFRYFSHDFQFNNSVMSLRAGQLTKESKGWVNDIDVGGINEMARDRNRLCIEDPFEVTYNVARTVTKDGLYTIRGEFMRATRILTNRPDRAVLALAELCREREDDLQRAPRSSSPAPRSLSASHPYTNGTNATHQQYRSQSQAPFSSHLETPGRQGRYGDLESHGHPQADASAQELWLASQGSNLGNLGNLSMGMGYHDTLFADPSRGRDSTARGLETPGGYARGGPSRRSASGYDDHLGSGNTPGSISAPLSPHAMYAKLEMGKSHNHNAWPSGSFAPPLSSIPAPSASYQQSYRTPSASAAPSRSGSLVPNGPHMAALDHFASSSSNANTAAGASAGSTTANLPSTFHDTGNQYIPEHPSPLPLPAFHPFSPPAVPSILRELPGEPADFISPSTLLSPPSGKIELGAPAAMTAPAPAPAPPALVPAPGLTPAPLPGPTAAASTAIGSNAGLDPTAQKAEVERGVEAVQKGFERMGVAPPGEGREDPVDKRVIDGSSPQAQAQGSVQVKGKAREKVSVGQVLGGVTKNDKSNPANPASVSTSGPIDPAKQGSGGTAIPKEGRGGDHGNGAIGESVPPTKKVAEAGRKSEPGKPRSR